MQSAYAGDVPQIKKKVNETDDKQHSISLQLAYLITRKAILYPGIEGHQKASHPVAEAVAIHCNPAPTSSFLETTPLVSA